MSIKLSFNTDFTRFYKTDNPVSHTIKVKTDNEEIECSGVLLAQHCENLSDLLTEDNILFLKDFTYSEDCLKLLHGGEITLDLKNVQDIMKFCIDLGVKGVFEQCVDWIEGSFTPDCVLYMLKISFSLKKFAREGGNEMPIDLCDSMATYLSMLGPEKVSCLYDGCDAKTKRDFLAFLTRDRYLMNTFSTFLCDVITNETAFNTLAMFDKNFDEFTKLPGDIARKLTAKISVSITNNSLALANFARFKEKLFSVLLEGKILSFDKNILTNKGMSDLIIEQRLWRRMDWAQIINIQAIFDTDRKHFIYSEMILAWIMEKKPSQEVVTNLTKTIIPFKMNSDYFSMVNDKLKGMGYNELFSKSLIKAWPDPDHFISESRDNSTPSYTSVAKRRCAVRVFEAKAIDVSFHLVCRVESDQSRKPVKIRFMDHCSSFYWIWTDGLADKMPCSEGFTMRCFCASASQSSNLFFYAATEENVHLQLHTDFSDAHRRWKAGNRVIRLGCIEFNSVANKVL